MEYNIWNNVHGFCWRNPKQCFMVLQNLTYPALIDALTKYTRRFIWFLLEGEQNEDFLNCKRTLNLLANELRRRKKQIQTYDGKVEQDNLKYVLDAIKNNTGGLN